MTEWARLTASDSFTEAPAEPAAEGDVLYDEGANESAWTAYVPDGDSGVSLSKNADHLQVHVGGEETSEAHYAIEIVDVTGLSAVSVEWARTGHSEPVTDGNDSKISVSPDPTSAQSGDSTQVEAAESSTFGRRTDTLDVSGVEGTVAVKVGARASGLFAQPAVNEMEIYAVETVA